MSHFEIRDAAQAAAIIRAYNSCRGCSNCPLNTPEGWRCGYLYERAMDYMARGKTGYNPSTGLFASRDHAKK